MVLEARDNLLAYSPLFRGVDPGALFAWLLRSPEFVPGTTIEFAGDKLFAKVLELETGAKENFRWETHREHVDLQFILAGGEIIGWRPSASLVAEGGYDSASDVQFYADAQAAAEFAMRPGLFAFFFPTDAHKPCVSDGAHGRVLKVVVKIHRSLMAL